MPSEGEGRPGAASFACSAGLSAAFLRLRLLGSFGGGSGGFRLIRLLLALFEIRLPGIDNGAVEQRIVLQSLDVAFGLRCIATVLRTDLHGLAGGKIVEQRVEVLGGQIFVIIVVDLHHRRIAAGSEALDLEP